MRALIRKVPLLRRFVREELEPPGTWTGEAGGTRVLIEEPDASLRHAMAAALREAGYRTAECAGPDSHEGRPCPLVDGHGCRAVDEADAVLQVFVPSDRNLAEVRHAIRDHAPDLPVAVLAPPLAAERHREDLDGVTVSTVTLSRRGVVDAAGEATGG